MISRDTAMNALKQIDYERHSIAPSISGYSRGTFMTVYFSEAIRKTYAYGENGKIHGYIAPRKLLQDHNAIRKMIGYNGPIVVIDSEGNNVAH